MTLSKILSRIHFCNSFLLLFRFSVSIIRGSTGLKQGLKRQHWEEGHESWRRNGEPCGKYCPVLHMHNHSELHQYLTAISSTGQWQHLPKKKAMLSTYLSHLSSATLEMAVVLQPNRSSSDNSTAEPVGSNCFLSVISFYIICRAEAVYQDSIKLWVGSLSL